jgi:hypothetical protein
MAKRNQWPTTAPRILYEAYPDQDLLPIEPPKPGETISQFKLRAEDAGDTLFLFLCREADDEIDAEEFIARLDRAARDIEAVRIGFAVLAHLTAPESRASAGRAATIKLKLDRDWIQIILPQPDGEGQRSGRLTSSLRDARLDAEQYNAAIDAIESMVLAHACAGIDVTDRRYVKGLRTALQACADNF